MADQAYEAIMSAVRSDDEKRAIITTNLFLRKGGDINRRLNGVFGGSLLHLASQADFLDSVRLLSQSGINIETQDSQGFSLRQFRRK